MQKKIELLDSKVQERIKDFALMMLGAPVVKIELDDKQLDVCVSRTCEVMLTAPRVLKWSDSLKLTVAQDGSLALAKMMLGRVRGKYGLDTKGVKSKSKSVMPPPFPLDAHQLLEEGERQYESWHYKVFGNELDM